MYPLYSCVIPYSLSIPRSRNLQVLRLRNLTGLRSNLKACRTRTGARTLRAERSTKKVMKGALPLRKPEPLPELRAGKYQKEAAAPKKSTTTVVRKAMTEEATGEAPLGSVCTGELLLHRFVKGSPLP